MSPARWPGALALALAASAAQADAPSFRSSHCWFDLPPGRAAQCGWFRPGDTALGRPVRLPVVRLPGRKPGVGAPVLYVPGGPGYPAGLDSAGMAAWWRWQEAARWDRDVILFDPRGTGLARPAIDCPEIRRGDRSALDRALSIAEENERLMRQARACYQRLGGAERLAAFTPTETVADIGALIAALPDDRAVLWGVSYGSRLALRAAQAFPERVARLLLDSALPPGVDAFESQPAQLDRALTLVERACAREPGCDRAYPNLDTAVTELLAQADVEPFRLRFRAGLDAPERALAVTPHRLLWMLLFEAYRANDDTRVAQAVGRAARGEPAALVPAARRFAATLLDPAFSHAVYYTASCADDGPVAPERWRALLARQPRVAPYLRGAPAGSVCRFWHRGGSARSVSVADIGLATLLLQGEADPVTPPAWSASLAARLSNSKRIVFRAAGHAVTFVHHCAMAVAGDFVAASERPPPACLAAQRAE